MTWLRSVAAVWHGQYELACDVVRAAFAVGSANPGFPFDVLALFTSQRQAERHADGAAYVFGVFVLPVYEDHRELPRWLRHPWRTEVGWRERISDEVTLTADALMTGEIEVVEPGPVAAVVDFDPPEPQEVRLLFARVSAAGPYLGEAAAWNLKLRAQTMSVYRSYDDCPPEQRYTAPGLMPFQLARPR